MTSLKSWRYDHQHDTSGSNDNYVNKWVTGLTAVGDAGSRNIINNRI